MKKVFCERASVVGRILVSLFVSLLLIGCAPDKRVTEKKELSVDTVKVQETSITIPTYEMFADDPYPRFNEWKSDTPIYPYPMKNSASWNKVNKEYISLVLENEYLKVVVLPEIGGHLYQFYDKANKRDIIYTNHVIKPGYYAVRGGWVSGGFEFNFPKAHSTTTISPIDYAIRTNPDGSAGIVIGDVERMYRMQWQVTLMLYPGKSFLKQEVKLHNRTPLPHRYHWWTIVATSPNDNTQVIFPTARVINHPQEYILSWPMWKGRDISRYKTLQHRFGSDWSVLEPWGDFFAYYDHAIDAGLVHTGDRHVIGGSKYFSHHNTESGRFGAGYLQSDTGIPYDEIDSSPFLTQSDHVILAPLGVHHWSEYWYPANGLQGLVKANRDGALNLYRDSHMIKVRLNVNFALASGYLIVKAGEDTILREKISLAPGKAYQKDLEDRSGKLSAVLIDAGGGEIISFTEILLNETELHPEGPVIKSEKSIEEMTVEEAYLAGIESLQEELPKEAEKYFKGALEKDSGYSQAHTQLGVIYLARGLWKEAESEFKASLARNPLEGRPYYYLGLTYELSGERAKAIEAFSKSITYPDTYAIGHHCLGRFALAQNNPLTAIEHSENALSRGTEMTETQGLLSTAYRKAGHFDLAERLNSEILYKEPINHLAAFEAYLLAKAAGKGTQAQSVLKMFLKLLRDEEHSYAELAWTYTNCGLLDEAIQVLREFIGKMKNRVSPMLYYQLGYLHEKQGNQKERDKFYEMGRSIERWKYVFPNRLEEFGLFESVLKRQPDDYGAQYALGNLLASRYRYQHAIEEWKSAAAKVESIPQTRRQKHSACLTALYRNLGFFLWKTEKKTDDAIASYQKAIQFNSARHFTCYVELANLYSEVEKKEEAVKLLESSFDKVEKPSELVLWLLPVYSDRREFDKVLKMGPMYRYDDPKAASAQRYIRSARLEKGKEYFEAHKFEEAIAEFTKATEACPENVPVQNRLVRELSEILWFKGQAYANLGKLSEAKQTWAEAQWERHEPISPNSFYQAKCLQAIGQEAEAQKILDDMLFFGEMYATMYPWTKDVKDRNTGTFMYLMALAYEGKGINEKAAETYKKVLTLMPDHKEAKTRLEQAALKK